MTQTHYKITAVVRNDWTGNHERELTAWVFGATSEYMPGGWRNQIRPHAEEMAWAYDEHGGTEGTLEQFPHEEYGLVWQEVLGWGENVGQQDSCVWWHLSEAPTDKQWNALIRALKSYKQQKRSYEKTEPKPLQYGSITLTKIETIETIIR